MHALLIAIYFIGAVCAWFTSGGVADKVYRWCLISIAYAAMHGAMS